MDVSEDGARALVIDYKTGSPGPYASLNDDVIDRGRRLQLGVYSLAARAVAPGAGRIEAAYWFVTNRGGFRFAPARLADMGDEASMDRLREGIGTIVRGIRSGAFPANPGPRSWRGAGENCTFCDFDSLCPSAARRGMGAKEKPPRAGRLPQALGSLRGRGVTVPREGFVPVDDDVRRVVEEGLDRTLFVRGQRGHGQDPQPGRAAGGAGRHRDRHAGSGGGDHLL